MVNKYAWIFFLSVLLFGFRPSISHADTQAFEFYIWEYETHYLTEEDPLALLIERHLAESVFDTTSKSTFEARLKRLQALIAQRPDRLESLRRLDQYLQQAFDVRLKRAKNQRWLYAAGGALVGALIAIPMGRLVSSSAQTLWISVPIGALAGAGAGFLLGELLTVPRYAYTSGLLERDLEISIDEIEELMRES